MARRFTSQSTVRDELIRRIGRDLDEDVWQELVDDGRVDDVWIADASFPVLEARYLAQEKRYGRRPPAAPGTRLERGQDQETELLSRLVAAEASLLPEVIAYRTEILKGTLLQWEQVPSWLEEIAEDEGPPGGLFYGVPFGPDVEIEYQLSGPRVGPYPRPSITIDESNPAAGTQVLTLAFAQKGESAVSRMAVRANGALDELRRVSEQLAEMYDWQPAQATVFVLAGIEPLYSRASVTFHYIGTKAKRIARLTFTVDPSLPATEVLSIFRAARRELVAPFGVSTRRKPVEEKSLRLAEFSALHSAGSWQERMEVWNAQVGNEHEEWAYSNRRNFQRDVSRVLARIEKQGVSTTRHQGGDQ